MEIIVVYDKKLVMQALRYHFIKRPEIRIMMILINVFAIFSAGLFYFKKVSPIAFLLSSFLWILLMVSFWFMLPFLVYRKSSTFRSSFHMQFKEAGIRLENEKGYTEWPWRRFSGFFETPHFLHLYFDSRTFFLVPKAAFSSDEVLHDLRKMLSSHIRRR